MHHNNPLTTPVQLLLFFYLISTPGSLLSIAFLKNTHEWEIKKWMGGITFSSSKPRALRHHLYFHIPALLSVDERISQHRLSNTMNATG